MDAEFNWQSRDLNQHRFIALTSLLRLRGEQQAQQQADDDSDEAVPTDADTEHPASIADSGNGALKTRFLDRLAEVISQRKGAKSVTATLLTEYENRVSIDIARNETAITAEDDRFKENLIAWMTRIAQGEHEQCATDNFYHELAAYNRFRYDEAYIPDFKKHTSQCESFWCCPEDVTWEKAQQFWDGVAFTDTEEIGRYSRTTHSTYMGFAAQRIRTLVNTSTQQIPIAERRCRLSTEAYHVRHMHSVWIFLQASVDQNTARHILHDIQFLGRTRATYMTFKEVASRLPNFVSITFQFLPSPTASVLSPAQWMSFEQAMEYAGISLDEQAVRDHFGNHKRSQIRARFQKIQPKRLHVHAEVQLVCNSLQYANRRRDPFPYIGCSKKSCFLCTSFLRAHGQFETRGCHEKVKPMWTIPVIGNIARDQVDCLCSALAKVEALALKTLYEPWTPVKPAVAESSAGVTEFSNRDIRFNGPKAAALAKSRSREQEARWIEDYSRVIFGEITIPADEETSDQITDTKPDEIKPASPAKKTLPSSGLCKSCDRETSLKCSGCRNVWFCSKPCQRNAWQSHIFECSPKRPLDSADWLWRACTEDEFPTDEQTCKDYGFSKLSTGGDMSKLLGLYIGLFKVLDVSTRTVHDWQRHNNLAKGIKDVFFKRLPEGQSGGYFPWFLQNQHLVDQSLPEPGNQGLADEMWLRAWRYIGGDVADTTSRIREIIHGWPDARQECFIFYSVILSESHPGPDMDGWILLGFCTSNQYAEPSEGRLCRLYRILATRVTFDEFYTAYNSSSLIGLIDRKDLREERLQFPYLEDVLAGSPEVFKSVWYLKKFTFTEDIYPERSVMVDYGFANCENPKERLELKQVYKQFFDEGGDAMELHRACLAGKLFEFLKAVRGVNQDFKRLLRNVYPLDDI